MKLSRKSSRNCIKNIFKTSAQVPVEIFPGIFSEIYQEAPCLPIFCSGILMEIIRESFQKLSQKFLQELPEIPT